MVRRLILKEFICATCGKKFQAVRKRKVCHECRTEEKRKYQHEYLKKRFGEKEPKRSSQETTKEVPVPITDDKKTKVKDRRCKYCGKWIYDGDFCSNCISEKFSDVYTYTGKTNGWDHKKRKPVYVKSGWRGRVCVGFGPGGIKA